MTLASQKPIAQDHSALTQDTAQNAAKMTPPPIVEWTARMEPFDSFWEAPSNIEKGYQSFFKFYKNNYLKHVPDDKDAKVLIISCGPGYFVNLLRAHGYTNVLGIDSYPEKVEQAKARDLNCQTASAQEFLHSAEEPFDVIVCEQELNHLTKEEMLNFLTLCWQNMSPNGSLIVHGLNGANPITGSEAFAQNFDHYNSFTEYTLNQILEYTHFSDIKVFPLNLYVFYKNPINYVLILLSALYTGFFRFSFLLYGKKNKIFTKKVGAVCKKPA